MACTHFNCDTEELAKKDPELVAFIKAGYLWKMEFNAKAGGGII